VQLSSVVSCFCSKSVSENVYLCSDEEDTSAVQVKMEIADLSNGRVSVSITEQQLGNDSVVDTGRGSCEGLDVSAAAVQTLSVQNQIKASSELNVISSSCDLREKILQPVKQPVGCTR